MLLIPLPRGQTMGDRPKLLFSFNKSGRTRRLASLVTALVTGAATLFTLANLLQWNLSSVGAETGAPTGVMLAMALFGTPGGRRASRRARASNAPLPDDERGRLEREEFARMERLAAAEEVAGEVAHAINNPLAVLLGRLQMRIERTLPGDDEDEILLHLARRIDKTVAGMLELSNRAELHPVFTPLAALLEEALRPVSQRAADANVKFETYVDPTTETIYADFALLAKALTAVFDNAIDAMPAGGIVRTEIEEIPDAGALLIRIQDPGCGMDSEILEMALEPFFTTQIGHTGLGLTLANRITTGHGGRLKIQTAEHTGTLVTFELPARHRPATA